MIVALHVVSAANTLTQALLSDESNQSLRLGNWQNQQDGQPAVFANQFFHLLPLDNGDKITNWYHFQTTTQSYWTVDTSNGMVGLTSDKNNAVAVRFVPLDQDLENDTANSNSNTNTNTTPLWQLETRSGAVLLSLPEGIQFGPRELVPGLAPELVFHRYLQDTDEPVSVLKGLSPILNEDITNPDPTLSDKSNNNAPLNASSNLVQSSDQGLYVNLFLIIVLGLPILFVLVYFATTMLDWLPYVSNNRDTNNNINPDANESATIQQDGLTYLRQGGGREKVYREHDRVYTLNPLDANIEMAYEPPASQTLTTRRLRHGDRGYEERFDRHSYHGHL